MDDGHPLVPVVQHFLTKGLLVVGVWGVKHVLWRRSRQKSGKAYSLLLPASASANLLLSPGCADMRQAYAWGCFRMTNMGSRWQAPTCHQLQVWQRTRAIRSLPSRDSASSRHLHGKLLAQCTMQAKAVADTGTPYKEMLCVHRWLVEACRDGDPDYVDISQLDERFKASMLSLSAMCCGIGAPSAGVHHRVPCKRTLRSRAMGRRSTTISLPVTQIFSLEVEHCAACLHWIQAGIT